MLKLLLPGAMMAPAILFGFGTLGQTSGSSAFASHARAVSMVPATAPTATLASCPSETLGVVLREGMLESHSANALGEAFADREGCEISFVRLTNLLPEDAGPSATPVAMAERREIASHINALVGDSVAQDLRVHADVQTAANATQLRSHAIVRVERRALPEPPAVLRANASAAIGTVGARVEMLHD